MGENSCVRKYRGAQLESKNSARKESLVRSSVPQALELVRRKIGLKLSCHRVSAKELEGLDRRTGGRERRKFPANCLYTTYYLLALEKGSCVVDFHRFRKKIHGFNF